jgi:hypothetical protein
MLLAIALQKLMMMAQVHNANNVIKYAPLAQIIPLVLLV